MGQPLERVKVRFSGRVQGVGFRATTVSIAAGFSVVGRVRNMVDGSVELVAEGSTEQLTGLLAEIRARLARNIVECTEAWSPIDQTSFEDFSIAPSERF